MSLTGTVPSMPASSLRRRGRFWPPYLGEEMRGMAGRSGSQMPVCDRHTVIQSFNFASCLDESPRFPELPRVWQQGSSSW